MFGRTREEREECPAGGMRSSRATIEPGRHASTSERVLEEAEITAGRSHDDRHLVERHAAPRLLEHAAGDLHAFAPLPRRGKELEGFVRGTHARLLLRVEQKAPEARQVPAALVDRFLADAAHFHHRQQRVAIPARNRGQHRFGTRNRSGHELRLCPVIDRDIEEHHRAANRPLPDEACGSAKQVRAIGGCGGLETLFEPRQQVGEIGPASGSGPRRALGTPASRNSCSVAASARGKPGAVATGAT